MSIFLTSLYILICLGILLSTCLFATKRDSGFEAFTSSMLDPVVGASNAISVVNKIVIVLFICLFCVSCISIRAQKIKLNEQSKYSEIITSLEESDNKITQKPVENSKVTPVSPTTIKEPMKQLKQNSPAKKVTTNKVKNIRSSVNKRYQKKPAPINTQKRSIK
jgi:preprotein translocase subunit SecG